MKNTNHTNTPTKLGSFHLHIRSQKIVFLHPLTIIIHNISTIMAHSVAQSITKHIANEWSDMWFELLYSHKDDIIDFFDAISDNPNLSMNIINAFRDEKWNWDKISKNWAFDLYDMKCNLDLPWDFDEIESYVFVLNKDLLQSKPHEYWIALNSLFTFDMVLKHPDLLWKSDAVTHNSTPIDINNNPDYQWDWNIMHCNQKITKEFVLQHKDKPWDWKKLSSHSVISIDLLWNLPNKKWDWDAISINPSITIAEIQYYKLLSWNYSKVFLHPKITIKNVKEFVAEYPSLKNTGHNVCDIMDAIIQYPNTNWYWDRICDFAGAITVDFVVAHPDKPWNYQKLMKHIAYLREHELKKHPTFPWDFSLLSNAPQFFNTMSQLQNENWNWNLIALQKFDNDRIAYVEMNVKFVLISSIYEDYEEIRKTMGKPDGFAESVFLDDYLLRLITKY